MERRSYLQPRYQWDLVSPCRWAAAETPVSSFGHFAPEMTEEGCCISLTWWWLVWLDLMDEQRVARVERRMQWRIHSISTRVFFVDRPYSVREGGPLSDRPETEATCEALSWKGIWKRNRGRTRGCSLVLYPPVETYSAILTMFVHAEPVVA